MVQTSLSTSSWRSRPTSRPVPGLTFSHLLLNMAAPRQLLPASPQAPTLGALPPASLQSCASCARGIPFILNIIAARRAPHRRASHRCGIYSLSCDSSLGYHTACATPRTAMNINTALHKPASPQRVAIGSSTRIYAENAIAIVTIMALPAVAAT